MKIILTMALCIVLSGCQNFLNQSKNELEDLDLTRQAAKNYLEIAPMQIGFVEGAMGPDIRNLPSTTLDAINELKELAADPNGQDDFGLGYSLGIRVRITNELVKYILKRYAPEVLRYWP